MTPSSPNGLPLKCATTWSTASRSLHSTKAKSSSGWSTTLRTISRNRVRASFRRAACSAPPPRPLTTTVRESSPSGASRLGPSPRDLERARGRLRIRGEEATWGESSRLCESDSASPPKLRAPRTGRCCPADLGTAMAAWRGVCADDRYPSSDSPAAWEAVGRAGLSSKSVSSPKVSSAKESSSSKSGVAAAILPSKWLEAGPTASAEAPRGGGTAAGMAGRCLRLLVRLRAPPPLPPVRDPVVLLPSQVLLPPSARTLRADREGR
mmetsp:Transcript_4198/g.10625  ORF Transcript_4198/g.10625 Transcript_4198/m.10625 type:complete len:266 (-) Transcript_4198:234-1031(-)